MYNIYFRIHSNNIFEFYLLKKCGKKSLMNREQNTN